MLQPLRIHLSLLCATVCLFCSLLPIAAQDSNDATTTKVFLPVVLGADSTSSEETASEATTFALDEEEWVDTEAFTDQTVTAAAALTQKLLIPAYFEPGTPYWSQVDSSDPKVGMVIINPADGPGTASLPTYVAQVNSTKGRGISVIGFVDTTNNEGPRPLATLRTEIENYYNWYRVQGIFLSETSENCNQQSYYQQLYGYIKTIIGTGAKIIIGSAVECLMNISPYNDVIALDFYGTYAQYQSWSPEPWTTNYTLDHFWHLIHTTATDQLLPAITRSKNNRAGYVYITSDVERNPWDTLPAADYWHDELTYANSSTVGLVGVMPGDHVNVTPGCSPLAGYVYWNGLPVENATVRVVDAHNNSLEVTTETSDDVLYPYYLFCLSDTNLDIDNGDRIAITASYGGQTRTYTYQVIDRLGIWQQDLLLSGSGSFTKPIATVFYRSLGNKLRRNQTMVLEGVGQPSVVGRSIRQYSWMLDGKKVVSKKATLQLVGSKLKIGQHTLTFVVRDSKKEESYPVEFVFTVE